MARWLWPSTATVAGEVWSWYALPAAASQVSTTWQIDWVEPRSTWIHCGSLQALAQRVPVLPSTAFAATYPAPSLDEAVAGRLAARLVVPQVAAAAGPESAPGTSSAAMSNSAAASGRWRVGLAGGLIGSPWGGVAGGLGGLGDRSPSAA